MQLLFQVWTQSLLSRVSSSSIAAGAKVSAPNTENKHPFSASVLSASILSTLLFLPGGVQPVPLQLRGQLHRLHRGCVHGVPHGKRNPHSHLRTG